MTESKIPAGELYSRVYLDRGAPKQDDKKFRIRLGAYCDEQFRYHTFGRSVTRYLMREAALKVPWAGSDFDFTNFFLNLKLRDLLDCITIIWRHLSEPNDEGITYQENRIQGEYWRRFVARSLKEENMLYRIDNKCGVRYVIDEQFELARQSTLVYLENKRYGAARDSFQKAFEHMNKIPRQTTEALRSIFDSLETVAKLMIPGAPKLDSNLVKTQLKGVLQNIYSATDPIIKRAAGKMFEAFADWVDACHNYRHAPGSPEPTPPTDDFTVFTLSSGAAILRWLITIDQILLQKSKV